MQRRGLGDRQHHHLLMKTNMMQKNGQKVSILLLPLSKQSNVCLVSSVCFKASGELSSESVGIEDEGE